MIWQEFLDHHNHKSTSQRKKFADQQLKKLTSSIPKMPPRSSNDTPDEVLAVAETIDMKTSEVTAHLVVDENDISTAKTPVYEQNVFALESPQNTVLQMPSSEKFEHKAFAAEDDRESSIKLLKDLEEKVQEYTAKSNQRKKRCFLLFFIIFAAILFAIFRYFPMDTFLSNLKTFFE